MKVNTPHFMESNIPDMIDLADSEATLLASVAPDAEQKACKLGEAFFNRVLDRYTTDDLVALDRARKNVESWFINLFRGKSGGIREPEDVDLPGDRQSVVPEAIWVLDLVLDYGEEVAGRSAKAVEVKSAFHKQLARELAFLHMESNQHQSYLQEMLLMD